MKKCPKCGTILDDSKKKCYMCGADLTISTSVKDFSSNFDNSIGSTISGGSDNIFNNGKDIDVDSRDIVDDTNRGSFFSHSSSSKDYFHSEISKLNEAPKKEKKKKKGGLFGKKKKKEDKQVKKITYSTNPKVPKEMEQSIIEKQLDEMKKIQEPIEEEKKENVIKSSIIEERNEQERNDSVPDSFKNFNSFLDDDKETGEKESIFNKKKENISEDKIESAFSMFDNKKDEKKQINNKVSYYDKDSDTVQNDFSKLKEKKKEPSVNFIDKLKSKLDFKRKDPAQIKELGRMAFNIISLVIFIGIIVFVYFKFLKIDTKEELSGLQFTVPSYFKLNGTANDYRFYVSNEKGNDCSIKVSYGPATNPDDFTERWFNSLKSTYEKEEGAVIHRSEMNINGNKWESQKIVYLPNDGSTKDSEDILPRLIYSLYVYNTSFYTVQFANVKEDNECSLQYDKFMNTLEFVEKNVR